MLARQTKLCWLEVVAEAVTLEQLLIIGRVVGILVERLELVPLDEQAPPVAALPEVDRAVHRLHAAAREPQPRRIEEHVGDGTVVDRLEEAAAARGLLLDGRLLAVVEGRDAPHDLAVGATHHPADGLAVGEEFVLRRVEHLPHVGVERADPVAVAFVDLLGQVEPFAFGPGRGHLLQRVCVFGHGISGRFRNLIFQR